MEDELTPGPDAFHILVVDDEEDVLDILTELIRSDGYRVTGVSSGQDALQLIQDESVDLVLTDLMMPGMNGWQLLQAIKTDRDYIPVIVITGFISDQGESILSSRQADGYLIKPVDHRRLHTLLKAHLFSNNLGRDAEVLVIDGDRETQESIEQALEKRGIYVKSFKDPDQALRHLKDKPSDLIISELVLPGADGFEICKVLQSSPDTVEIPILILSDQPSRENLTRAIQLGVHGFVAKPFESQELAERVLKILQKPEKP